MHNTLKNNSFFYNIWTAVSIALLPFTARAFDLINKGNDAYNQMQRAIDEKTQETLNSPVIGILGHSALVIVGFIFVILLVFFLFMFIRRS